MYAANCLSCHGDAQGKGKVEYVPSNGVGGHAWQHSDTDLEYIVEHGSDDLVVKMRQLIGIPSTVPLMPAFSNTLSKDDVQAVVAYIKTFWTDDERRQQQSMKSFLKSSND